MLQQSSARQDICKAFLKILKIGKERKKKNKEFQLKTLKPVHQLNNARKTKNN